MVTKYFIDLVIQVEYDWMDRHTAGGKHAPDADHIIRDVEMRLRDRPLGESTQYRETVTGVVVRRAERLQRED